MAPTNHRTRPLQAQAAARAPVAPLAQAAAGAPRPQPPAPPHGQPVGVGDNIASMMLATAKHGFVLGLLCGFVLSLIALIPGILYDQFDHHLGDVVAVLVISGFLGVGASFLVGIIGLLSGALQALINPLGWNLLERQGLPPERHWSLYRSLCGLAPSLLGYAGWMFLIDNAPSWLLHNVSISAPLWLTLLTYPPATLIALTFWNVSGRLAARYAQSRGANSGPLLLYIDQPDLHDPAFQQTLFECAQPSYRRSMLLLSAGQDQRLRRQLAKLLDLQPGMRVCDLMSGSGEMWEHVLARIGPHGSIVAVEHNPAMLQAAREHQNSALLERVALYPTNALQTGLPSASFNAVVCAFGSTMLSPMQCMALADEIQRLLDDHGIFGIIDLRLPQHGPARADYRFYLRRLAPLVSPALLARPRYVRLLSRYTETAGDGSDLEAMLRLRGLQVHRHTLLEGRAVALVGMNIRSVMPPRTTQ